MFLYVMDAESRDKLLTLGFELLKANPQNTIWVFVNKQELAFDSVEVPCVVSDTLTF